MTTARPVIGHGRTTSWRRPLTPRLLPFSCHVAHERFAAMADRESLPADVTASFLFCFLRPALRVWPEVEWTRERSGREMGGREGVPLPVSRRRAAAHGHGRRRGGGAEAAPSCHRRVCAMPPPPSQRGGHRSASQNRPFTSSPHPPPPPPPKKHGMPRPTAGREGTAWPRPPPCGQNRGLVASPPTGGARSAVGRTCGPPAPPAPSPPPAGYKPTRRSASSRWEHASAIASRVCWWKRASPNCGGRQPPSAPPTHHPPAQNAFRTQQEATRPRRGRPEEEHPAAARPPSHGGREHHHGNTQQNKSEAAGHPTQACRKTSQDGISRHPTPLRTPTGHPRRAYTPPFPP